jgi:hypothetical protein
MLRHAPHNKLKKLTGTSRSDKSCQTRRVILTGQRGVEGLVLLP